MPDGKDQALAVLWLVFAILVSQLVVSESGCGVTVFTMRRYASTVCCRLVCVCVYVCHAPICVKMAKL